MCGIVGLISTRQAGFWQKELNIFKAMLVNDAQRGEDSTGAFTAFRDGTAEAIKAACIPHLLYMTKEWEKYEKKSVSTGRFLVGHNRKATQGQITSVNAHPFREGHIIMVHNGTLNNHHSWKTGKDVDSHALCQMLNEHGHEEILPKIEGAYALVWYNTKTERLYLCRNDKRPLTLVIAEDVIAFASESWMAYGQLMREDHKIKEGFPLEPGTLYEFDMAGKMTTSTFKPHTYTAPITNNYASQQWRNGRGWSAISNDDDIPTTYMDGEVLDRPKLFPNDKSGKFKGGELVQVNIHRVLHDRPGQPQPYKCIGSVMESGKPTIDFVGYLPLGVKPEAWSNWMNTPVVARVSTITTTTCGPSIMGHSLELDTLVETFNGFVGEHTWHQVCEDECCSKCGNFIDPEDGPFTSINSKRNDYRIHCHKCIVENLKGQMKNDFINRRNTALQERKPVSQSTGDTPKPVVLLEGPTTVH